MSVRIVELYDSKIKYIGSHKKDPKTKRSTDEVGTIICRVDDKGRYESNLCG